MTVAYVLAGGANLGAVQVGMLRALADRGVRPDLLIGTSAGALNAAFLASRGLERPAVAALGDIWRGLRTRQLFHPDPLRLLGALAGRKDALFDNAALRRLIRRHVSFDRLEDSPVPITVVTIDLLTGEQVNLSSGDAAEAILASAAIPGVFPAMTIDGRTLVDGGISNNAAISKAVKAGADTVYVLPCGYPCALTEPPRSALGAITQTVSLLVHQRLMHEIPAYTDRTDLIVLPPPCPISVGPMDFSHGARLIDDAYAEAESALARDGGRRDDPAAKIAMHTHLPGGRIHLTE